MSEATVQQSAVVLGATGSVGVAVARGLHARGVRLVLGARDPDRLASIANDLGATAVTMDARDPSQIEACIGTAAERYGRLDAVANCVGTLLLKPAHLTSDDEWRETIDVNLTSCFSALRAATRAMTRTGGSIVFFSSAAARLGLANHEAIAAAKAGVQGLALAAAASYGKRGIRVNVVAPGLVESNMSARLTGNPASRKASESMHALGRIGQPEDVASAVLWLLDPANAWVTGQIIGVDGGLATLRAN